MGTRARTDMRLEGRIGNLMLHFTALKSCSCHHWVIFGKQKRQKWHFGALGAIGSLRSRALTAESCMRSSTRTSSSDAAAIRARRSRWTLAHSAEYPPKIRGPSPECGW
ncbi:hypothetical protein NPIL_239861 [Nephila pilipes]|uniref:Uncharacterized protein n=1 Tax=Nephila pilipes TaxID=299642 RepID=A0A8X6TKF7_NEPPI|nr:hypothetical protein NPIL_239861 [Nephila pilipes]